MRRAVTEPATRTAVVQPLPGIGDVIWHLPHFHALADAAPDGKVTVITKPRTAADRLLAADPQIDGVLWVDINPGHGRRGVHDGIGGLWRLARLLRAEGFGRIFILHRGWRYAFAAWAAGIPERRGYGAPRQTPFLTHRADPPILATGPVPEFHSIERADRFIRGLGLPLGARENQLRLDAVADKAVAKRLNGLDGPPIALILGASEAYKQWGAANYGALAAALVARGRAALALVGGPAEAEMAGEIAARAGEATIIPALGWPIEEAAALVARCALVIGNDTGLLNLAPAVGTPAIALCGGTPALTHSRRIHSVTPPGGWARDAMPRITVEQVLAAFEAVNVTGMETGESHALG